MRSITIILICLITFSSCKSDKGDTKASLETKELTIAEKIANAHGYKNWDKVSEVKFTFKVDRDTVKGKGRSWVWKPKSNEVTMKTGNAIVSYRRHKMDSSHFAADRAFINDKYWFMVPFQLVWDSSATISESHKKESPIENSCGTAMPCA